MTLCPCCSGFAFGECCGPLVKSGAAAPTAVALMRSRYTAYVRRDEAYLLRTWHPSTRPASLDLDATNWLGLEVVSSVGGGITSSTGEVAFVAHYQDADGTPAELRESSRFVMEAGAWLYVDGDHSPQ